MSSERWQRVGALFDRALAAPVPERLSVVRSSGEPGDVQDEVLALLESHDDSAGFLEPPSLLDPGAQVGAYRIERIIGRGGMGVVYLAQDSRLHRAVALKALPPHLFLDDRMRARLRQEARAAAALSHPAVATVYALEEIGDQIFIASEFLEGRTLRDELAGGPLDESRALSIATQIAAGLQAAHDRGIVHRDLKPENIILTASGGVKVLDFGLAQFDVAADDLASVAHLTEPGVMAGTPPYMAPEQLLGQATSPRTDQFAFGVVLYEMLTGRHPFGGGPLPTTIAKLLSAGPDQAGLPDRLYRVITRAMAKVPDERFASLTEVVTALGTAAAGSLAPGTLAPGTPAAGTPAPGTPAPGTPAPGTPALGTPAPGTPAPGTEAPGTVRTVRTVGALNWWSTHQLIVALGYWSMVWPAWEVHKWTGRWGVVTFLATLGIVIVGGNTRLHLWFLARTYPAELSSQRAAISGLVRVADVAFSLMMIATGLVIADEHTGWGALFLSFGLGGALAFLVIEPATARAAFGPSPISNLKSEI